MAVLTEGMQRGPEQISEEAVRIHMDVSSRLQLVDLARDYVFLNHGALLTWGRMFPVDPVAEYVERTECPVCVLDLPYPIFRGLWVPGMPEELNIWDFRLLLVPNEHAPDLIDWVRNVSAVDRSRKRFFRTRVALAAVRDVLAMQGKAVLPDVLPEVPVMVFLVDGTHCNLQLSTPHPEPFGTADIRCKPIDPETIQLARAIFRGDDRPFAAIEPEVSDALEVLLSSGLRRGVDHLRPGDAAADDRAALPVSQGKTYDPDSSG